MSHILDKLQNSSKDQKRFSFLESVLIWEGTIVPQTLADQFEIHKKQAEILIHEYMELYPENLAYNGSQLVYEIQQSFIPKRSPSSKKDAQSIMGPRKRPTTTPHKKNLK